MTVTKTLPVIMSTPMVQSLNARRKRVTRRMRGLERFITRGEPRGYGVEKGRFGVYFDGITGAAQVFVPSPYGGPGTTLYVREGVRRCGLVDLLESEFDPGVVRVPPGTVAVYIADGTPAPCDHWGWKNKALPAIHMPYGMRRHELYLTSVTVERLHAITEDDAKAEGVDPERYDPEGDCWTATEAARTTPHRVAYEYLWNELNGWAPNAWDVNPFVWRLAFDPRVIR